MKSYNPKIDQQPVVVIDSREKIPLIFKRLPTVAGGLYAGDYSVRGCERLFAVERKSIDDLAASCVRSRRETFEKELARLKGYRFRRLLITATEEDVRKHRYRSNMNPNALLASIRAFEMRYDIPLVWEPDPATAALRVEEWIKYFVREVTKDSYAISQAMKQSPSLHAENTGNHGLTPA